MRLFLFIAFIVVAVVVAVSIARGNGGGTNINEREKYWAAQISASLPPGATKPQLEAFATANGQALECFQNYEKVDICRFVDAGSQGGTSNLPMRLAVDFAMKDDKVQSHDFGTVSANAQE